GTAIAQGFMMGLASHFVSTDPKEGGFWNDMKAGLFGLFGANPLQGDAPSVPSTSMGFLDEISNGSVFKRMFFDMMAATSTGTAPTTISIGDIVVPPGLTPEQAQQVVSRGVQDGIDRSELRRAVRAGESPVAY